MKFRKKKSYCNLIYASPAETRLTVYRQLDIRLQVAASWRPTKFLNQFDENIIVTEKTQKKTEFESSLKKNKSYEPIKIEKLYKTPLESTRKFSLEAKTKERPEPSLKISSDYKFKGNP